MATIRGLKYIEAESGDLSWCEDPGYLPDNAQIVLDFSPITLDVSDHRWYAHDFLAGALNLTEPI